MHLDLNRSFALEGLQVDTVAAKARSSQRTYAALIALAPQHAAERAELLAAGVAATTVEVLYPLGFEQLAPNIIVHLAKTGMGHLRVELNWLTLLRKQAQPSRFSPSMSLDLSRIFSAEMKEAAEQPELRALIRFIEPHLYPVTPWPGVAAKDIGVALQQAHWLMRHRGQLPDVAQRRADELMVLLGAKVLPNLNSCTAAQN